MAHTHYVCASFVYLLLFQLQYAFTMYDSMDNAFKFDEKTGGLCSEEDYPYEAKQNQECRTDCTDVPGSIVRTFYDVPPGDEMALLAAIAMQPISIAIQANQFVFQFYKTGVLTDSSCGEHGDIDHGVLAVGYGTDLETQEPYFLVKVTSMVTPNA